LLGYTLAVVTYFMFVAVACSVFFWVLVAFMGIFATVWHAGGWQ
jgi:hypothetical protein